MIELPERILSGSAEDWQRSVLESAELDVPTLEFRRTFARRLNVALGTAGVLTVGSTSHAATGLAWLKWLALGFVVGAVGAGASVERLDWAEQRARARPLAIAGAPRRVSEMASRDATHTTRAREPMTIPASSAAPASAPTAIRNAPSSNAPSSNAPSSNANVAPTATFSGAETSDALGVDDALPSTAKAPALSLEMAWLESVRATLAHGDPSSALQALDAYDVRYPSGALSVEALVLRIESLTLKGDNRGARSLARRFLREQPGSPYAKRVASIALSSDGPIP